jgi:Ca2+-binding EF-hand superfamily protein
MNGISAGKLLLGLSQARPIENKLNRLISKKDANGDNALSIKELGVGEDAFSRIDKNGDGKADKFELIIAAHNLAKEVNEKANQGVPVNVFDRIDKNGDGDADKVELGTSDNNRAHAVNEGANQLLSKKDTNGDGVLNTGELGVPEKAFNRIDKNGDGQIGIGELNIDARNKIAANNRAQAVNERISHLLSKKDTNGNGSLDAGELGMPKDVFNKIDKDRNGQVGRYELNAAASARAVINNLLGDILPNKEPSKLDAIA